METKQAVELGRIYLTNLFGDEIESSPRLEEVWRDGKNIWHVIFGIHRKPTETSSIGGLKPFSTYERKVVRVDDASGSALSLTDPMRDLLDH